MSRSISRDPRPAGDIVGEARSRATTVALIQGPEDKAAVLDAFASGLDFPSWAGRNLDAFEELIGDLSWLPDGPVEIVWSDAGLRDADPSTHGVVLEILSGAVVRHEAGDHPLAVTLTA